MEGTESSFYFCSYQSLTSDQLLGYALVAELLGLNILFSKGDEQVPADIRVRPYLSSVHLSSLRTARRLPSLEAVFDCTYAQILEPLWEGLSRTFLQSFPSPQQGNYQLECIDFADYCCRSEPPKSREKVAVEIIPQNRSKPDLTGKPFIELLICSILTET
jgi:hypothetical protein